MSGRHDDSVNYKRFCVVCILLLLGGGIATDVLVQRQTIVELGSANAEMKMRLEAKEAQLVESLKASFGEGHDSVNSTAFVNAAEIQQLQSEHVELLRLRGEVNVTRREREELRRQVSVMGGTVAREPVRGTESGKTSGPEITDAEESRDGTSKSKETEKAEDTAKPPLGPGASPIIMGSQMGALRRKALAGQPLSAAEKAQLDGYVRRIAEIEKSPGEFASFQTANIAGFMGWRNDARQDEILKTLDEVRREAAEMGLDFQNPAQNSAAWTGDQMALNQRARDAIQNLLDAEERQVFSRGFPNVLGIDFRPGAF